MRGVLDPADWDPEIGLQKASEKPRAAEDANDMQMSAFKSHLPTPRPYFSSPWLLPLLLGVWAVVGGIVQLDTAIPTCGWRYCEIL